MKVSVREAGDRQVGRNRRAKRQRSTQQRLRVLSLPDDADLDEAAPNIPVSLEVGHEPTDWYITPAAWRLLS